MSRDFFVGDAATMQRLQRPSEPFFPPTILAGLRELKRMADAQWARTAARVAPLQAAGLLPDLPPRDTSGWQELLDLRVVVSETEEPSLRRAPRALRRAMPPRDPDEVTSVCDGEQARHLKGPPGANLVALRRLAATQSAPAHRTRVAVVELDVDGGGAGSALSEHAHQTRSALTGPTGACPDADVQFFFAGLRRQDEQLAPSRLVSAIIAALLFLRGEGILLIETQLDAQDVGGTTTHHLPLDAEPMFASLIACAIDCGVTVVLPSGNKIQSMPFDLDQTSPVTGSQMALRRYPRPYRTSHCRILVGAYASSAGEELHISPAAVRSNVGSPITTSTIGSDFPVYHEQDNACKQYYYRGTSGASAIVAGAAAEVISSAIALYATAPTAAELSRALVLDPTSRMCVSSPPSPTQALGVRLDARAWCTQLILVPAFAARALWSLIQQSTAPSPEAWLSHPGTAALAERLHTTLRESALAPASSSTLAWASRLWAHRAADLDRALQQATTGTTAQTLTPPSDVRRLVR